MDNNEDLVLLLLSMAATNVFCALLLTNKKRRERRWWVRPIYQNRIQQGAYYNLMAEMRLGDQEMFFHFTRFTVEQFDSLLRLVGPHITKRSNRTPLNSGHRLAITLRFLATGSSLQTLAFQFRIGKATACKVVNETCQAIWDSLQKKVFIKYTKENWMDVARTFENRWNYPHCIGALDGKHVRIQAPPGTGSEYFNYKHYFSVILMAMCDGNYKFTFVDIGAVGSESDGGVFSRSKFGKMLTSRDNLLNLPPPCAIEGYSDNTLFPYCIVADEAFPLKENIMRPYPGKSLTKEQNIFNYRLSRARRIIENTFGILVSRWRIFQGPIVAAEENVNKYIQAAVCLHNYLLMWDDTLSTNERKKYCPANYVDRERNGRVLPGEWRENIFDSQVMEPLKRLGSNNAKKNFFDIRNQFASYFVSDNGALTWQDQYVMRGTKRQRIQ